MIFYLVRHGETEANVARIVCGQLDTPLTEHGREQAIYLSTRLKDKDFDFCFTTPLQRAYETAQLAYPRGEFKKIDALVETNTGDASYLTIDEFYNSDVRYSKHGQYSNLKYPNGESIDDLYKRIVDWLECFISNNSQANNVLIVGHGGTVNAILHYFLSVPILRYPAFQVKNAAYAEVRVDLKNNVTELLEFNK